PRDTSRCYCLPGQSFIAITFNCRFLKGLYRSCIPSQGKPLYCFGKSHYCKNLKAGCAQPQNLEVASKKNCLLMYQNRKIENLNHSRQSKPKAISPAPVF